MPILKLLEIDKSTRLGVWHIEEEEDFFLQRLSSRDLPDSYEKYSPGRRLEYLASRYLLKFLFNEKQVRVLKDANGKPSIEGKPYQVSISHSKHLATVMISDNYELGVDIEVVHHKVKNVMHKFLSEREQAFFDPEPDIEKLILCWSAKESLYKIYGEKELSFQENILLEDPATISDKGSFKGFLIKDDFKKEFEINFEKIGNSYLTYILA